MHLDDLRSSVRELATLDENDDLVLSAYLSVGGGVTAMLQRLRRRLDPVLDQLEPLERESLVAATQRAEGWLERGLRPETRGVAIFARAGERGLLLPLQFRVEVPDSITVDSLPSIYHLCELKDTYHCYVVLIATEERIHVLEVHLGAVTRQIWRERPELRRRVGREWTKEHFRGHRRAQSQKLVREAVAILEARMDGGGYRHLVLAGNPRVLADVRAALPKRLREAVIDQLAASGAQSVEDVVTATLSTFVEEEQRESSTRVEVLLDALHRDGLAVVGEAACRQALLLDAADELVLSTRYEGPHRDELVRLAERSNCGVEFVEDSSRLDRVGGVGCLLRYRFRPITPSEDVLRSPSSAPR